MWTHIDHDDVAVLEKAGAPDPARTMRKVAGRGVVTNPAVRFDTRITSPLDDGWATLAPD
jgi:hypothetical protein